MQPPKRQIIKTRSQRPYVVARVVALLIALAMLVLGVWFLLRPHPARAMAYADVAGATSVAPLALQEAHLAKRMAAIPTSVERKRP